MANCIPNLYINDIIAAAENNDFDHVISNAVSMATQLNSLSLSSDRTTIRSNNNFDSSDDDTVEDVDHTDVFQNQELTFKDSKTQMIHCEEGIVTNNTGTKSSKGFNVSSDAYGVNINVSKNCDLPKCAHPSRSVLNTDIIEEIENDLQFFEKVSLVFLLYDSDDLALQRLKTAYRSLQRGSILHCRLLSDWALHETSDNWQLKFLEALCIIKNMMWVKKLGFNFEEANKRFLPQNPDTSLNVDLLRKAMYIVCESLSCVQLKRLLILVEKDMENVGCLLDKYDVELMEMNILHWMSQRYLNVGIVGSCVINIKNLTKHLKVMEEYKLVDYLDSITRRCCKTSDNVSATEQSFSDQLSMKSEISQGGNSSHSVVSKCQDEQFKCISSDMYFIDPKNVGFCVIINQKKFYKEPNPSLKELVHHDYLEPRIGTDIDRDRLCEIFMSYGFNVQIWENLTHIELLQAVHEAATKLVKKEHSCFALCVLSHGRKNAVYGVNSIAVDMEEIQKLLHGKYCPNLLHKPKVIIVQACQGLVKQNAYISDIGEDGSSPLKSSPEVSDTVTFWATVPGYAAFRDRITGSWFVRALWDEMLDKGSIGNDLISIFINVNARVCDKRAPIDGELKAMTPLFSACLRKKLVFPYNQEARKAVAKRMFERYIFDRLLTEFSEKIILANDRVGVQYSYVKNCDNEN